MSDDETNGYVSNKEGDKLRAEIANQSFASNEGEKSEEPASDNAMPNENFSTPEKFTPVKLNPEKAGSSWLVAYDSSPERIIIQNSSKAPKFL